MPFGVAALIVVVVVTIMLVIVTDKKRSKITRITAGIFGGLITLSFAGYLFMTLLLFGAV